KDCIGAIDGVHVPITINCKDQIPFIGRKGIHVHNVMAACKFDMLFTFSWVGSEGLAHDTRISYAVLHRVNINFSHPPQGNLRVKKIIYLILIASCLFFYC
ncbi:DDE_4 domain-containing protein, partial [Cephalotus follicularis]